VGIAFLDEIIEIAALSPPHNREDALTEILMSGWIGTSHNALLQYKALGWAAWIALPTMISEVHRDWHWEHH
jgi:hypothetical protein